MFAFRCCSRPERERPASRGATRFTLVILLLGILAPPFAARCLAPVDDAAQDLRSLRARPPGG